MSFLANLMTAPWAIRRELLPLVARVLGRVARGEPMSLEDRQAVEAGKRAESSRRVGSTQYSGGSIAVVGIYGVLSQRGGIDDVSTPLVSADRLTRTIRTLAADSAIGAIVLDVDSPGGSVYGIEELGQAIYDARAAKPVAAIANSLAASAAYWIASQASDLYAAPGAEVGSIGVYTIHTNVAEALAKDGLEVTLVSAGRFKTEGNPYGALGAEARAHIQEAVDQYYDAFVRAVARGRGTSQKAVRDGMGQGRVLQPDAAKAENMIDGIATLDQVIAKMQARVAGRDRSAVGMRDYVARELSRQTTTSSPASGRVSRLGDGLSTRDAVAARQREIDLLALE